MLRSLRAQWFWIATGVTVATLVALAVWLRYEFHTHFEEEQIAELRLQLDAVTAIVPDLTDATPTLPPALAARLADPRWQRPYSGWYWQIERREPAPLVWTSRSLWDFRLHLPERGVPDPGGEAVFRHLAGPDHQQLLAVVREVVTEEGAVWRVVVARDLASLVALEEDFFRELTGMLVGVALLLLAGGLVQWLVGVRSLQRLTRALDAVKRGEAETVAGRYPEEIAAVVGALNALLHTQREQNEAARRQTGELAHALKTPLAAILQIARHEAPQPWAEAIVEQAESAHAHVRHFLALARAEASRVVLGKRTNLAEVLDKTSRALATIFADRELEWIHDWPDPLWAVGDARDLTELFGNLLENAARHARSRVVIHGERGEEGGVDGCRVVIEDDGPGWAPGAPHRDAGQSPGEQGLLPQAGLGLTVIRSIVSALGGTIAWEQSTALGGTRVVLFLPGQFVAQKH